MSYTVTVYVASPGTPLLTEKPVGQTSGAGHVWYSINDGHGEQSFGFAPIKHGEKFGAGHVVNNDVANYKDPVYARTMEISKDQYDKLKDFGASSAKHGFDMKFNGIDNACIDYTWNALNHAELYETIQLGQFKNKTHEGSLKPLDNIDDIQSIKAPFPNSSLNREVKHPLPDRTIMQWIISEEEKRQSQTASIVEPQLSHPKAITMLTAVTAKFEESGDLRNFSAEERKNICAAATRGIVEATPMVGKNPIDFVALSTGDNGLAFVGSGPFIARFNLNQAAQTPATESLAQTNMLTQNQIQQVEQMRVQSRGGPSLG